MPSKGTTRNHKDEVGQGQVPGQGQGQGHHFFHCAVPRAKLSDMTSFITPLYAQSD